VKRKEHLERSCHPDDLDRIPEERRKGLSQGVPFAPEMHSRVQNVVERAVILSETDTFDVDESWLSAESDESSTKKAFGIGKA